MQEWGSKSKDSDIRMHFKRGNFKLEHLLLFSVKKKKKKSSLPISHIHCRARYPLYKNSFARNFNGFIKFKLRN